MRAPLFRPVESGFDDMGEPITEYVEEHIDGVIWQRSENSSLDEGERPNGVEDTLIVHLPKTYTASVKACLVEIEGNRYECQGDPIGYMEELCPTPWNRPVYVKKVEG